MSIRSCIYLASIASYQCQIKFYVDLNLTGEFKSYQIYEIKSQHVAKEMHVHLRLLKEMNLIT